MPLVNLLVLGARAQKHTIQIKMCELIVLIEVFKLIVKNTLILFFPCDVKNSCAMNHVKNTNNYPLET